MGIFLEKEFIENEIKRIANEYKVPESRVALFAGKRLCGMGLCDKDTAMSLQEMENTLVLDKIIQIATKANSNQTFDFENFFYEVDRDFWEDFGIIQMSKLDIWKEEK